MNTNRKAYYFQSNFTNSVSDDLLALSNNECTKVAIKIETVKSLKDNLYLMVLDDATDAYTLAISEVLLDTQKSHHNLTQEEIQEYEDVDPEQYADKNTIIIDTAQATQKNNKETIVIQHPTQKQ